MEADGASGAPVDGLTAARRGLARDTVSSKLKLRSTARAPRRPNAEDLPIWMSVFGSRKIRLPKEPPANAPTSQRPVSCAMAGQASRAAPARRVAALRHVDLDG